MTLIRAHTIGAIIKVAESTTAETTTSKARFRRELLQHWVSTIPPIAKNCFAFSGISRAEVLDAINGKIPPEFRQLELPLLRNVRSSASFFAVQCTFSSKSDVEMHEEAQKNPTKYGVFRDLARTSPKEKISFSQIESRPLGSEPEKGNKICVQF